MARDFLAGIGPDPRESAVQPASARASPRNHSTSVQPTRKYTKTNHVAGPGRGIHTATTRASVLIEGEKVALAKALLVGWYSLSHHLHVPLDLLDFKSYCNSYP